MKLFFEFIYVLYMLILYKGRSQKIIFFICNPIRIKINSIYLENNKYYIDKY